MVVQKAGEPAMSSKLKTLRSNLDSLRKRRSSVRLTTAYSGFLAAAIWVVFGCFLLDWALEMTGAQRVILMLGEWLFRKLVNLQ